METSSGIPHGFPTETPPPKKLSIGIPSGIRGEFLRDSPQNLPKSVIHRFSDERGNAYCGYLGTQRRGRAYIMVSVEGYHVSLSWVRSMLSAHFGVPHPLVLWWWCICCVSLVASRLVWCVIVACCICEFASDSVVEASSNLVFFGKLVNGSFSLTGLVFPEDGPFSCPVLYMSP
ncbi:hypothetical protein DY000_02059828 [Brassica cretica]|uniref:Uncharacterized protein n=1 Tax=Brassica cretica TaxID=69181 RepID=A0ABQ7B0U3_BRACR|nr:hypothetical protein DY000_02059828 [Brassica cretica]